MNENFSPSGESANEKKQIFFLTCSKLPNLEVIPAVTVNHGVNCKGTNSNIAVRAVRTVHGSDCTERASAAGNQEGSRIDRD